ncbi:hypothetical protein FRC09_016376, partial [Ceratobasidium sp. 395]
MACSLDVGKLALPSTIFDKPMKRCIDTPRSTGPNNLQLSSDFTIYENTLDGSHYYGYRNNRYLTTNDLHNPAIADAFRRSVESIDQCASNHGRDLANHEVLIYLRCISERNPKFSYYIVDHNRKTIGWAHEQEFNDSPELYDVIMRNVAEYWHHRNQFCIHRPCNQGDYDELLELLNNLPRDGREHGVVSKIDARFSENEIMDFRDRLARQAQEPATVRGTTTIAYLHASVLKEQLHEFYEPNWSLKSKLLRSLHGIMRSPKFLHRRTHRAHRAQVQAPIPPANDQANPAGEQRSLHPTMHSGRSPVSSRRQSPQSSTDSNS